MIELQKLLSQLDFQQTSYSCDPKPQKIMGEGQNIQKVVTGTSQIRIRRNPEAPWEVWAPVLYQSCMEPEIMQIRPLTAEACEDGTLRLATRYASCCITPADAQAEASIWNPVIQKADCRHCKNCGRCSW